MGKRNTLTMTGIDISKMIQSVYFFLFLLYCIQGKKFKILIYPDNKWKIKWDIFIIICLLYYWFVVPIEYNYYFN